MDEFPVCVRWIKLLIGSAIKKKKQNKNQRVLKHAIQRRMFSFRKLYNTMMDKLETFSHLYSTIRRAVRNFRQLGD